ncbi:RHS repeat domain-containing protein [Emticicia sp. TH156]|uniref:RHS repeat domain-containing protein n=1 Tax=Emticicia sp. TH156 TaxID=2067454 RepID=UPI000C78F016|nr:RHS repeat-associated core domain-containing protein [Emticicia sp. TH156]PLK42106.1 hypothetical protein C0V77_22600 [Emticicia sp. TH156]
MKADKNEDITDIIYSTYANQPVEIQLTGGRWIKNFYDGAGRLYKTSYSTGEYWEYLDGMVFKNGAFYQLATPEGRANYQSGAWSYEYFITDHLGNTRVAYKANGTALTKTSETAFDPWGIVLKDVGLVNGFQNKFEYQNKEKESTFNLRRISFGARTYNASIGRFDGVDPLAELSRRFSAYNYVYDNPLLFVDPDGRFGDIYNQNGTHIGSDGEIDDRVYVANTTSNTQLSQQQSKNLIAIHDFASTWGNKEIGSGLTELKEGHKAFQKLAAVTYAESSERLNSQEEKNGIASASVNNNNARGPNASLSKTLGEISNATFDGNANYSDYMDSSPSERNSNSQMTASNKAAINALTGGKDYSNGAIGWDGRDLRTNSHRAGLNISDPSHDIFKVGDRPLPNGKYTRQTTAAYGQTVFMKIHKDHIKGG